MRPRQSSLSWRRRLIGWKRGTHFSVVGSRPSLSSIGEYGRDPRSRILWQQRGRPLLRSGLHVRAWLLHSAQSSDVGHPGGAKAIERAEKLRANGLLGRLLPSSRQSGTNPHEREGRLRFLVPAGSGRISQGSGLNVFRPSGITSEQSVIRE